MQCARIATYRVTSGSVDEVIQRAQKEMLPIYQGLPGFVSFGAIKSADGSQLVSVTMWQTAEQANAATKAAAQWTRANVANNIQLEQNIIGDVAFFKSLAPMGV
jgi:heme-degrading monooxygenase HmoA